MGKTSRNCDGSFEALSCRHWIIVDNSMLVMVNGYEIMSVVRLVPYLVPILFSLIIVVGSVGNILVVLVVVMNKTMRNNTNILILNLAVSPIL